MLRGMFPAPAMPAFAPEQVITSPRNQRYEDCTQDGRLTTIAIPPALATLWDRVDDNSPAFRNARRAGIVSLLTRLTVQSLDAPIRVQQPVTPTVGYQLAHERDAAGAVARLYMNVWAEVRGLPAKRVGGELTPVLAGRAFAEHVFTRPFAPAAERRVVSLAGIEGYPDIPEAVHAAQAPASAGEAPAGATWLDDLAPDAVDLRFTLDHTDANQHVNSLVYVRYFLDAFTRRLAAGGYPSKLRSQAFDIAYRKPSFAGDRVRAHLRMFALGDRLGAAGHLAAADDARPRSYVRVLFGP